MKPFYRNPTGLWQIYFKAQGYFQPINQCPFWYYESLVHVFHLKQSLFLQKSKFLYPNHKYFGGDWDLNLGCKKLAIVCLQSLVACMVILKVRLTEVLKFKTLFLKFISCKYSFLTCSCLTCEIQFYHFFCNEMTFFLVIFSRWKMESSENIRTFPLVANKVILQKSRREVSPVEQDSIDCKYLAYVYIFSKRKFSKVIKDTLCNFLVGMLQFKKKSFENMKKLPSKVVHNRPQMFFFSIASRPKTSPNIIFSSILLTSI